MEEKEQTKEKAARGKRMAKSAAREICYTAMFVAIITVCAWISIPIGEIPITAANDGRMPGGGSFGVEAGRDRDGGLHIAGALRRSRIYGIYGGVAKLVCRRAAISWAFCSRR